MKVTVIGSGVMGPGIAQTWLLGGHQVALTDLSQEALQKGLNSIKNSLSLMHQRGLVEKDADQIISNL
ncbi:MAG: 3-hydroxyacyl-CoA dehydrogenase NAD-binding domain-containing protein, partial [Desulfocucumaceae bacterium]